MKLIDRLQLEAADLSHRLRVIRLIENHSRVGIPDVAHDVNLIEIIRHNLAEKRRRRRFPVRSRDRVHAPASDAPRELDLAPHRHADGAEALHHRDVARNSRTHNEQLRHGIRFLREFSHDDGNVRRFPELLADLCDIERLLLIVQIGIGSDLF